MTGTEDNGRALIAPAPVDDTVALVLGQIVAEDLDETARAPLPERMRALLARLEEDGRRLESAAQHGR